jgi:hypothetical protein
VAFYSIDRWNWTPAVDLKNPLRSSQRATGNGAGSHHIIFQHLLASIVKSRLAARFGDIESLQAAATGSSGPAASRGHSIFKSVTAIVTSESI